jgi:uncharacterized damage-inducible protein DinB
MLLCLLLVLCSPLAAEHHEKEAASVYGGTLAMNFEYVSGQLVQLAEAMPEGIYGWRPADEVRTTSEVLMHVVGTNMLMPTMIGVAPAEGFEIPENPFAMARELETNVTAKADVMAKLQESIGYAKGALANFPEAALDEKVDMFGMEMRKRDTLLLLLSHSHEHLGQLIAYARSNGVKPPWSQPMPEAPPE